MSGFPAFGLCLTMLVWLWYEHVRFFRRYGLQDGITIVIQRRPAVRRPVLRVPAEVPVQPVVIHAGSGWVAAIPPK
jgi:hypothetical protein